MKFILEVKDGTKVLASVAGRIDIDLPISEMEKVIEVEQFLEKILGFRFHINQFRVAGGKGAKDATTKL